MTGVNTEKKVNESREVKDRFREIKDVLLKNHITRGVSPEKLRIILEELGPTFIKLGQIMSLHSDILPKRYCDELMKLNSEVTPMPFETVVEVINGSYRTDYRNYFAYIEPEPLGSASIAQVHKAKLKDGSLVIVKVQRKGIYDTMSRDIALLHRVVKLMPSVGDLKNLVDLDMVLDEMWTVAQDEMDFLKEASNLEEFARNNKDITYISCPSLYKEYCTGRVLVMEYIDGWAINDAEDLKENGYDLEEIGIKYVNNFIKQVMDDGFFHADPHPGNVKIRDGKIVWIDMGMMGRLSERDRRIMVRGVKGIALHDVTAVENAVLDLGDFRGKPDRDQLYKDLKDFLEQFGNASMGEVNIAVAMEALMDVMKNNHIALPHGMTMLCRGLAHAEGVLADIAPDINMFQIATNRVTDDFLENLDLKKELGKDARLLYRGLKKGAEIPALTTDVLKELLQGQTEVNINLHASTPFTSVVEKAVRDIVIGVCIAALLVASAIQCTATNGPMLFGISLLGLMGYAFAFSVTAYLVIRHIYLHIKRTSKRKKKR